MPATKVFADFVVYTNYISIESYWGGGHPPPQTPLHFPGGGLPPVPQTFPPASYGRLRPSNSHEKIGKTIKASL